MANKKLKLKKQILAGIGLSNAKDAYTAGKEAAVKSLKELGNKKPSLSFVFFAGDYNPYKLSDGLKSVFQNSEFIGGSTDGLIYDGVPVHEGVLAVSIYSDYLHFGIASSDNISKDPKGIAEEIARAAIKKISIDKYLDPYLQFMRMKQVDLSNLIRIPSFFTFVFTRGFQVTKFGNEDDIIEGILDATGQYIPLFGGSLGSYLENVFTGKKYEIFSLHSGKVLKDGLIVAFGVTGLLYAHSAEHGYTKTNKLGYISEVENSGFVVSKVCDENIITWYAKNVGVSEKDFLNKIMYHTQKNPLGFPDGYGNVVMRAGGVPFEGKLSYIAPFKEHTPVFVMDEVSKQKVMNACNTIKKDLDKHLKADYKPALSFVVSCASRRALLGKDIAVELKKLKKTMGCPVFGFFSFGEIGSKPAQACRFHHLTTNVFNFYDKMLFSLENGRL